MVNLADMGRSPGHASGERLNVLAMTAYNAYQTFCKRNVPETDAVNTGKGGKTRAAVRP